MLQLFVGSNRHYYLEKWHSAASPQKRAGWNWVAFFVGPLWLAYRKMNRQLAIYYAVVIAGFISVSLLRLINLAISSDSSAIWLMVGLIAVVLAVITFIMPFIFGMDANKWYYNHSQRHIRRLQSKSTDHQQLSFALTRTGGTSFLAAFFICILSTVLLIVWFVFDTAINGY
ncbi:DUF2628 domain-containing protein [Paenibacillus sp. PAMC21692]|uniref:DUF2628 domain-containing protein n=1 Tax=Paenibacillus sp. PAMC21692 TaxID=2762320 RepID=UPI00164EBC72|nr:DUF2628 domain-containing protein [Paenibacillus sp. PAMC21692]QNK57448.1 DUF2628 domain-containing protein [Paenibacillus sp. PAMC21692]